MLITDETGIPGRAASRQVVRSRALAGIREELARDNPQDVVGWFRLRRDRHIPKPVWDRLGPRGRLRVMVDVVSSAAETPRVNSHHSAAAVLNIPTIGSIPTQVECIVPDNALGRSPGVIRHRSQNPPAGVMHDGVLVTPPDRTAVDLARLYGLACGVAAMDDVLHRGLATYADLVREREAIPKGGRGRQRARLALALADGLAESAGESLSRVRLYELGYARPVLQKEFRDTGGVFVGRTDMYWDTEDVAGEFDGEIKYRIPPNADPKLAAQIVWEEKQREDALRKLVDGVARWVWSDALRPDRFQAVLASYGLRPRHDDSWMERF